MRHSMLAFLALCFWPLLAYAQTPPTVSAPATSYRVTFTVRELSGGKPTGSRNYSATMESKSTTNSFDNKNNIRSGSRVPIATGEPLQIQYIDVGANFDFHIPEFKAGEQPNSSQLPLVVTAELSSVINGNGNSSTPVIRQNRWSSNLLLDLNKPTLLFSSDDPSLDRTTQVELTVVKLP